MELLKNKKSQTEPPGEGRYADKVNPAVLFVRGISSIERIFGDLMVPVNFRTIGRVGGGSKFFDRTCGFYGSGIDSFNDIETR